MENIISALISRGLVRDTSGSGASRIESPYGGKWFRVVLVLIAWVVMSPILIHHDFSGINIFALPVVTVIAAMIWPIGGIKAMAWVFALHALNSVAEPIARIATGYEYDPFGGYRVQHIVLFSSFAVGNAIVVGLVSYWRLRRLARKAELKPAVDVNTTSADVRHSHSGKRPTEPDFVGQLGKLAELHEKGDITDEEYQQAKERVLKRAE